MKFAKALLIGATLAFGAVSVTTLQGCSALGLPVAETFNERVAVAYSTVTAVRQTATTLLEDKKISADDAQNVLDQTDHAREGIEIARQIHAAAPDAANARLQAVLVGLRALSAYLEARK